MLGLVVLGLVVALIIYIRRRKHLRRETANVKAIPINHPANIRDKEVNRNTRCGRIDGEITSPEEMRRNPDLDDRGGAGSVSYPIEYAPVLREKELRPGFDSPLTEGPESLNYDFLREPPTARMYRSDVARRPMTSSTFSLFLGESEEALTSDSRSTQGRSLVSFPPSYSRLSHNTLPSYRGLSMGSS